MSIRITGGEFKGHKIPTVSGRIRPTAARVRQALFDILGDIEGLSFVDLYAGTGAVGIEAASRGANPVIFVESDKRAARKIAEAVGRLDLPPKVARIRPVSVLRFINNTKTASDIIFADPPYITNKIKELATLLPSIIGHLSPRGFFVLQLSVRITPPSGFNDSRIFGDDVLYFWHNSN